LPAYAGKTSPRTSVSQKAARLTMNRPAKDTTTASVTDTGSSSTAAPSLGTRKPNTAPPAESATPSRIESLMTPKTVLTRTPATAACRYVDQRR